MAPMPMKHSHFVGWVRAAAAILLIYTVAGVAAPTVAASLSGTYVATSSKAAFLLQLVETGDHNITGHYEQVVLAADGKLDDMNAAVAGATDGTTIILTIRPNALFGGTISVSGGIENGRLHLSGGGNGSSVKLVLTLADEAIFQDKATALSRQAAEVVAAHRAQDAAETKAEDEARETGIIQILTRQMVAFVPKAHEAVGKLQEAEDHYKAVTRSMRDALDNERATQGDYQAAVKRSEIAVKINQAAVEVNQTHISVQSASQSFDTSSASLLQRAAVTSETCQGAHASTDANPVPEIHKDLNAACVDFIAGLPAFKKQVSLTSASFAHAEKVWAAEHDQQDTIVKTAEDAAK
jgi:hypothetical protein